MKHIAVGLLMAGLASMSTARADVISSSSLQNINGLYGAGLATTTTNSTGRQTIVVGPGGGGNRATGVVSTGSWFQANVGGGGTVGITSNYAFDGNGSTYFSTTSGDSKGDLQYYFNTPVELSSVTSLAYDFYRSSTSTIDPNLAPVFRIDILKAGAFAGSLVFENVYQNQTTAPVDSWTMLTATLNSGIFWATNAALGPTFAAAAGGQKTLQSWIDANSGSDLTVIGMSIGAGSGWNGTFQGAIDDVSVAFNGGPNFTSNFEVAAATAVPEPASMVLTVAGIGALSLFRRRRTS